MPKRFRGLLSSAWLMVVGLCLTANWLYVPWTYTSQRQGFSQVTSPLGYAFLTSPPDWRSGSPRISDGVEIDYGRIVLQTAAIAVIGLMVLTVFRFFPEAALRPGLPKTPRSAQSARNPSSKPIGRIVTAESDDNPPNVADKAAGALSGMELDGTLEEQPSPLKNTRVPGRPIPIVLFWLYLTLH